MQGLSEAPFLVKKCVESWERENPEWNVIFLDENNLDKYIDPGIFRQEKNIERLSLTKQSNLYRLQVLSEYGGVWADATTYCMKPLDDWIHGCTGSGFFVFYRPGRDRLLSTWFMVSEKGCPLTEKIKERYASFFIENDFDNSRLRIPRFMLTKILNRSVRTTRYWFAPFMTKVLRIYPYFVFHYMFERLIATDEECRYIWEKTKKISAGPPHRIARFGLYKPVDADLIEEIDAKKVPIYKLSWKKDPEDYSPSTALYYLLEGRFIK